MTHPAVGPGCLVRGYTDDGLDCTPCEGTGWTRTRLAVSDTTALSDLQTHYDDQGAQDADGEYCVIDGEMGRGPVVTALLDRLGVAYTIIDERFVRFRRGDVPLTEAW